MVAQIALLLAAVFYISAMIIRSVSVRSFSYGPYQGQLALDYYLDDLGNCTESDDLEFMIDEQTGYWKQRRAYILFRNVAIVIILALFLIFCYDLAKQM